MNNKLVIDATSDKSYIYLVQNDKLIDSTEYINNKDLSYKLIEYVVDILSKNNLNNIDLNEIYLVYGPGKFSAMRICSTLVKTWKLINQCKIFILDKFDYLSTNDCVCVLNADGNKYFVLSYNKSRRVDNPVIMDNNELKEFIMKNDNKEIIKESNNKNQVLDKLKLFKEVDENFELEYLKKPC